MKPVIPLAEQVLTGYRLELIGLVEENLTRVNHFPGKQIHVPTQPQLFLNELEIHSRRISQIFTYRLIEENAHKYSKQQCYFDCR